MYDTGLIQKIVVLLLTQLLISCASKNIDGYYQYHTGEPLPPAQKAIVEGSYSYRDGSLANEMTRIVAINGEHVPKEWGVAEGANKVSLLPGYYELKILYVHGAGEVDYYSYAELPAMLRANCTYKIVTKWSSLEKTILYGLVGKPNTSGGNGNCSSDGNDKQDVGIMI